MKLSLMLFLVIIANTVYCKKTNEGNGGKSSKSSSTEVKYYTELSQHVTIPVVIHFDKALTDRLAKEGKIKTRRQLEHISKNILIEAAYYFRHPSLNHSVHFDLKGTRYLKNRFLEMDDNASNYLRTFCTWQSERKWTKHNWWYSILLTGMDLFYYNNKGEEIRSSTARSYLGGVCSIKKSCAVLEWNPMNIGYLLAHEIGHSLGINHDGLPHNKCKPHVNIMSSSYPSRHHPKTWSQCNKQDLKRFLLSRKSWCLRNVNIQRNKDMKRYSLT